MIIDFSVENFFSIRERQTLSFLADDNIRHLEDYYVTEIAGKRILKAGLIFGANAIKEKNAGYQYRTISDG